MLEITEIMDEEAGYTKENAPAGFGFFDDNCSLLTPTMYENFGYPILEAIFHRFSPNKGDQRYQHSDSEMAKDHRGLNIATAGSINNGSLLTSMRTVMYAIQTYGQR